MIRNTLAHSFWGLYRNMRWEPVLPIRAPGRSEIKFEWQLVWNPYGPAKITQRIQFSVTTNCPAQEEFLAKYQKKQLLKNRFLRTPFCFLRTAPLLKNPGASKDYSAPFTLTVVSCPICRSYRMLVQPWTRSTKTIYL